ncbi:hypothetical protein HDV03_001965 [Kappamyces sp. JEL0829]|nr:hypothetical protein HDV03_001965 [Kappamyces sp. JEL0829]KAJ3359808.1 hypothetical protein HDU91_004798 [Kappamyces sp. JEL0680]
MKLAVLFAAVAAVSKLEKPSLLSGMVPQSTTTTSSSILVAGIPANSASSAVLLKKLDASLNVVWSKDLPSPSGVIGSGLNNALFSSSMLTLGTTTYLLTTDRFASDSPIQSQLAVIAVDAATGTVLSRTSIPGASVVDPSTNHSVALTVATGLVASKANPSKVYLLGSTWLDAAKSRYGYTVHRFDITTKTVDWSTNYLPSAAADGGSLEAALEVNGRLFVAGGLGLVVLDAAGSPTPVLLPGMPMVYSLASLEPAKVLVSSYSTTAAVDTTTLQTVWTKPGGFVRNISGGSAGSLLVARTDATSGNAAWSVSMFALSAQTGASVFATTTVHPSGSLGSDSLVGASSENGITTLLLSGATKTGCLLFGLGCRVVPSMQLLRYNGSGQKVFPTASGDKTFVTTIGGTGGALYGSLPGKAYGITYDGSVALWTL